MPPPPPPPPPPPQQRKSLSKTYRLCTFLKHVYNIHLPETCIQYLPSWKLFTFPKHTENLHLPVTCTQSSPSWKLYFSKTCRECTSSYRLLELLGVSLQGNVAGQSSGMQHCQQHCQLLPEWKTHPLRSYNNSGHPNSAVPKYTFHP